MYIGNQCLIFLTNTAYLWHDTHPTNTYSWERGGKNQSLSLQEQALHICTFMVHLIGWVLAFREDEKLRFFRVFGLVDCLKENW